MVLIIKKTFSLSKTLSSAFLLSKFLLRITCNFGSPFILAVLLKVKKLSKIEKQYSNHTVSIKKQTINYFKTR